jgi:glycyl-tRNA synthetase
MTQLHDNIVGLDAAILMHPRCGSVGHVENFTDPLVDCKKCKQRFPRGHDPDENRYRKNARKCGGEPHEPRNFNLMFRPI